MGKGKGRANPENLNKQRGENSEHSNRGKRGCGGAACGVIHTRQKEFSGKKKKDWLTIWAKKKKKRRWEPASQREMEKAWERKAGTFRGKGTPASKGELNAQAKVNRTNVAGQRGQLSKGLGRPQRCILKAW